MRCLTLACIGAVAASTTPAFAQDLCARLTVPPELGLGCSPALGLGPEAVEVTPIEGTFAALSRMTVRRLERSGADASAWTDPGAWLQSQVRIDTSGLEEAIGGLAQDPDSPFAGGQATTALESLKRALAGLTSLALTACDQPVPDPAGEWRMRCNYTADGLGLLVALRLVADDDERWSITMRAANEQRLRHFEAIANSFQTP